MRTGIPARIVGVVAVHVFDQHAARRAERGGQENRRTIRSPAAERHDALARRRQKTRHHDDVVLADCRAEHERVECDRRARRPIAAREAQSRFVNVESGGADAVGLQRQRQQRHRSELARRPEQIQRSGAGHSAELLRFAKERVGVSQLGRYDRDEASGGCRDEVAEK